MKFKRMWWIIHNVLTRSSERRADYAREKGIYHHVGKNVSIQPRTVPIYSELISFGDNVRIARNVDFVTHDVIHAVLNLIPEGKAHPFSERIGCIEICDNVFIGSNSVILYGVKINSNVIIASGSVVVKDCEADSVYAGVPAKKVGTFHEYVQKRIRMEDENRWTTTKHNQSLTDGEVSAAWRVFRETHGDERTI